MELITQVFVCAIVLYFWYKWKTKHMNDLTAHMPGIKRLPWKAMTLHLLTKNKERTYNLYNVIERIIAPFPHLSKGWLGPFCLIDIRNPEYVKKVLNSDKCIDRASFYSFPYKTGLLFSGGDLWKRHRKLLNPAFSTNKLNKFMPTVNQKARKLTDALDGFVGRDEFNVVRLLSALTIESLLRTSFGISRDFINNPYDRFFTIVKKEASNIGKNIYNVVNLFLPKFHRENEFTRFCQNILVDAENERKQFYNNTNNNFIDILLNNKASLSSLEIQDEVSTLILSGNASTALSMSAVLLMLAMHKDVQDKVYEEFKSVFYDGDEEIDKDNITKLKYFDMVIRETLRLFPIAPVIGRKLSSDLVLDDQYTLPKGVNVIIRIIDIQRSPVLWGDDANQFRPERFEPERFEKIHPYAYIPFSSGARICIGYRYALNVMKIVLCHILRKFEIQTPLKYEDLKLEISFVLRISQNYMISIKPRNQ